MTSTIDRTPTFWQWLDSKDTIKASAVEIGQCIETSICWSSLEEGNSASFGYVMLEGLKI